MSVAELAAMLLLAAVWGGSYLFIRVAVPEMGPFPLMAARVVLGGAILIALPHVRRAMPALRGRGGPLLVLGAANAALPFTLIAAAELRLPASIAAILGATVPLFSSLLGALWLGERITPRRAAGLLLGVGGVAVLVGWSPLPATRATILSVAATLVASCAYAFAGIHARRRLADVPPPALAAGQQLAAAAWLVVPAAATAPAAMPSARALAALLGLATVSTAVAYLLYFFLLERIGPTRTPTVTYLIPVFGTAWGALFLHEHVSPGMIAGTACVLASVLLVNGMRLRAPISAERGSSDASTLPTGRRTNDLRQLDPTSAPVRVSIQTGESEAAR